MSSRLLRLLHKNEKISGMTIFDNPALNRRPITYCEGGPKDIGTVKAAIEGCEIGKTITLEKLDAE
jgi:hypothetical protein